jgi:hypothetical protein
VFVVDALTVKFPPRYVGVGAAPNVTIGCAFAIVKVVLALRWPPPAGLSTAVTV